MVKATETKARKRKLIIYECISGLLLVVSGLIYSINHTLAIASILLLLGGLSVGAFALRLALINNGAKHSKATAWWFIVAVSALLLCGYLFWLVINIKNPEQKPIETMWELPTISLDVGPTVDPKDPWGTGFIISNQGRQTISNVWATAYWYDPTSPTKGFIFVRAALNPAIKLLPTMKQGLHFAGFNHLPPFGSRTFVNVDIRYTPYFLMHETNQVFQFCVVKDVSGNFVWAPAGEGESFKDINDEIVKQKLHIIDTIPYLDVQINSVENNSQADQRHPIKINYSWKNIGGKPATGVYVEWTAWDISDVFVYAWSNQWSATLMKDVVWPGEDRKMATAYADEHQENNLFNGIMSGSVMLVGMVNFKDFRNHDYLLKIGVIRTNGLFDARCLDVGGYFNELIKPVNKP